MNVWYFHGTNYGLSWCTWLFSRNLFVCVFFNSSHDREVGIFIVNLILKLTPLSWCYIGVTLLSSYFKKKPLIHFYIRNFTEYRKGKEENKNHLSMSPNVFLSIKSFSVTKNRKIFLSLKDYVPCVRVCLKGGMGFG